MTANWKSIETICSHVANGGSLVELCKIWEVNVWDVKRWLSSDPERKKIYAEAQSARAEFVEERVLQELRKIAFSDVRKLYAKNGSLLPITELSDEIAPAVASMDVFERLEDGFKLGETKKIKLHSKLDALKLLGEYQSMWKQVHELNGQLTLEDLLTKSREEPDKNVSLPNDKPV